MAIVEDEYTFRRCNSSDISEISDLLNKVLEADRNSEYLTWKYFKNPAGQALSALSLLNGRVVGQLGAIPVRFLVKAKEFTCAQELDVAIFEDHRRFDIFFTMTSLEKEIFLKEDIDFSYSFTNELTSEIAQTLNKKAKISPIPRLVRVLDVRPLLQERFVRKILLKRLSPIVNAALRMKYCAKTVIPEGMQIKQITRFDERFDILWNQTKGDYPIMTVRDSAYLNWRYVDALHMKYEVFCLEETESNAIAGFIVLVESGEDFRIGQIFDIITPRNEDDEIASCLVNFAVNRFCKRKVAAIRCWMLSHCHIYPALAKAGFVRREKKGRDLIFQSINMRNKAVTQDFMLNKKNWYITKGDSDIN